MKKLLVICSLIVLLCGCQSREEKVEKLIQEDLHNNSFENINRTSMMIHERYLTPLKSSKIRNKIHEIFTLKDKSLQEKDDPALFYTNPSEAFRISDKIFTIENEIKKEEVYLEMYVTEHYEDYPDKILRVEYEFEAPDYFGNITENDYIYYIDLRSNEILYKIDMNDRDMWKSRNYLNGKLKEWDNRFGDYY